MRVLETGLKFDDFWDLPWGTPDRGNTPSGWYQAGPGGQKETIPACCKLQDFKAVSWKIAGLEDWKGFKAVSWKLAGLEGLPGCKIAGLEDWKGFKTGGLEQYPSQPDGP